MSAVFVPASVSALQSLADAGVVAATEVHAAAALVPGAAPEIVVASALALGAPRLGHAYADLATAAADAVVELARRAGDGVDVGRRAAALDSIAWPEPDAWVREVATSAAVRVVDGFEDGPPLDDRPFVLHGTHLYTQRQWVDECVVAARLRRLAASDHAPLPLAPLAALLDPDGDQYAAAAAALQRQLAVVVGGPGTGKTYTVGRLLAAVHAAWPDASPPRLGLAAPTGKAAARLTESIQQALGPDDDRPRLPEAVTLHRLLGPLPDHRTRFRHHAAEPLPYDLIVVDETSMVPLPLMARLLEAVPDGCRLVLLGDPDQLESIEVGAVLADIVRGGADPASPLHGCVTRLRRQFRTGADSPIGPLADAVRDQRADEVVEQLRAHAADEASDVSFVELDDGAEPSAAAVDAVRAVVGPAFAAARTAAETGDRDGALAALDPVRILCAHRRGPFGVEDWNRHAESWLFERPPTVRDYIGRPLLATRNDPRTGIVNGATGVIVAGAGGVPRAVFRRGGRPHDFAPAELDELETAYAMTVHKTQGSEYDTVVVIHPSADSPLATRELLYTAVTRAARRLVVVGSPAAIRRAVTTPARRLTGLAAALAAPAGGSGRTS